MTYKKLLIVNYDAQRTVFECPPEPNGNPFVWTSPTEDEMAEGCALLIGLATPKNCTSIPANSIMPVFHRCDGHWPIVFRSRQEAILAGEELSKYLYQPVTASSKDSVCIIFTSPRLFVQLSVNGISEVGIIHRRQAKRGLNTEIEH